MKEVATGDIHQKKYSKHFCKIDRKIPVSEQV